MFIKDNMLKTEKKSAVCRIDNVNYIISEDFLKGSNFLQEGLSELSTNYNTLKDELNLRKLKITYLTQLFNYTNNNYISRYDFNELLFALTVAYDFEHEALEKIIAKQIINKYDFLSDDELQYYMRSLFKQIKLAPPSDNYILRILNDHKYLMIKPPRKIVQYNLVKTMLNDITGNYNHNLKFLCDSQYNTLTRCKYFENYFDFLNMIRIEKSFNLELSRNNDVYSNIKWPQGIVSDIETFNQYFK
jgi:hypothetical protein